MNHSDSSATLGRIIRAKIKYKGPGRKIPKIFWSQLFRAKIRSFRAVSPIAGSVQEAEETQA
jgi:hypothetical protein